MQSQFGAPSAGQKSLTSAPPRRTRHRISYVLPLANATAGHRLGVNGLAFDRERSILYTAGRDGVIYAWDSPSTNSATSPITSPQRPDPARNAAHYRQHVQAHTHWINDITLVGDNTALVSASSDNSIKLWRPHAEDVLPPQTIGLHNDYAKVLASPGRNSRWVASGGLDRKITLWDLERGGQRLQIQSSDDEVSGKGSIYALCANENLIVSGGPDSVVKVWDVRSGKRVTQFVGHTDNIRGLLISQDSEIILSSSADQTVKMWSVFGARSLHTLTMHNDSVWCLHSQHPQLSVFYSGDRAGFVAKTDTRGVADINDGLSIALCQEHTGVSKLISSGNSVWTATASSSVNRWADADTSVGLQIPESMTLYRWNSSTRSRASVSSQNAMLPISPSTLAASGNKLPLTCVLRMSITANWPPSQLRQRPERGSATVHGRKTSAAIVDPEIGAFEPLRSTPESTIQGQNGLTRHILLSDRRRALTVDTAGEVMLWDLLQCTPVKSFGKRPLDDVVPEINTAEAVAHWCNVDTRTGMLRCSLEETHCFDAEMYADELKEASYMSFREDQRINLGKWVLRYLFAALLDEEILRDERYRQLLTRTKPPLANTNKPNFRISMPPTPAIASPLSNGRTPRPNNFHLSLKTPGLAIGVATPGPVPFSPSTQSNADDPFADPPDNDYFSARPTSPSAQSNGTVTPRVPATPSETHEDRGPLSPSDPEKKESGFKKFRMSFVGKKSTKAMINEAGKIPAGQSAQAAEQAIAGKQEEPVFEHSFIGTVQKIRSEYTAPKDAEHIESLILPALPNELPVLKPPLSTTVIIQEESHDSAGMQDLYEGTIGNLGRFADRLERVAPLWLGDVLLRNRTPQKDIVKISFTLEPYNGELPLVTGQDGSERLNANRMLRARKILAYAAEKLEALPNSTLQLGPVKAIDSQQGPASPPLSSATSPAAARSPLSSNNPYRKSTLSPTTSPTSPPTASSRATNTTSPSNSTSTSTPNSTSTTHRPEDWLTLYCGDNPVPLKMTLATIRTHVWKGGGDVALFYRLNGRRSVKYTPGVPVGMGSSSTAEGAVGGVVPGSASAGAKEKEGGGLLRKIGSR